MKIQIRVRGLDRSETDSLRDHAARRILIHLSRFDHAISSVFVRISDVNGPRGGVDKECHITVRGSRRADVLVENLSSDTYSAVDLAVERAGRAVGRDLDRLREFRSLCQLQRRAS
jgi:putative sigma-54 modulation protein